MKRCSTLATLMSLAMVATTAHANLLGDPSFDLSDSTTQTSNSAWVLDVNDPDGATTPDQAGQFREAPWASNPAGQDGKGVWFRSFEGDQGDSGEDLAQLKISQLVGLGSLVIGSEVSPDLTPATPNGGAWVQHTVVGVAPAGTTGVRAFGLGVNGEDHNDTALGSQSAFFDDFDLTLTGTDTYTLTAFLKVENDHISDSLNIGIEFLGVPEPTTAALASMGLLGMLTLRRKR